MKQKQRGKTAPEKESYKAISVDDPSFDDSALYTDETSIYEAASLMKLFQTEDWVFITADLLASNFALPYPRVMKKSYVDGKELAKPAENHSLQELLDDPTLYADAQSFWYVAGVYDCILGNTILWYMKENKKFMVVPAHEVTIRFEKGVPKEYVWQPTGSLGQKGVVFKEEDIIHVKRPNPVSKFWGMSPFIPGSKAILFNRYSGEFLNSFFEKGATPQMVVETEISNNKEAITTLAKSFELVNSGRKNQRRPLVLPKGAKVTQVNMTISDTKLFEFVNQNREVILQLLRIPKHAVGLQTAGSLGSEEHKTSLRFMWGSTVTPMLKRYSTALTKFFRKRGELSSKHFIDFDCSDVEIANEDMNRRADFAVKISKTHTVNEVRRIVFGAEPLPGADFIPGVWNDPAMMQQTAPKKPPNDGGEQPNPDLVPPPVQPPEAQPTEKVWHNIVELESSDNLTNYHKDVEDELVRADESMVGLATDVLLKQADHVISLLRQEIPQKSKAFDADAFEAEMTEAFRNDISFWQDNYKKILSPSVEVGYSTQLKLVFDPVNRDAVEALRAETANGRKAILSARGIESFSKISKTTTDDVMEKITAGMAEGKTVSEIAGSIADSFKANTLARAQVIARTETLTAVSVGQDSACKNAAKVIPDAVKVWLSGKDSRVRDTHEKMHGVTVKVTEKFRIHGRKGKIVELNVPRDPKVKDAPEEVIQCRCTVAIISAEDRDTIDA